MSSGSIYGVISGDVIDSSRFEEPEASSRFQDAFHGSLDRIQSMYESSLYFDRFETFQWDSFQTVVDRPQMSLRIALRIYLELLQSDPSIPCRISLGVGPVESTIQQRTGEAFRLSGRGLEEIKRGERFRLKSSDDLFGRTGRLGWESSAHFLSSIMRSWNARQARALAGWLEGNTQQEIAGTIKPRDPDHPGDHVSQQYISKILADARARPVRRMVENFENISF